MVLDVYDYVKRDGKYDYELNIYENNVDIEKLINDFIIKYNIVSRETDLTHKIIKFVKRLKGGLDVLDCRQIIGLNGHICFYDYTFETKWILVKIHKYYEQLYTDEPLQTDDDDDDNKITK